MRILKKRSSNERQIFSFYTYELRNEYLSILYNRNITQNDSAVNMALLPSMLSNKLYCSYKRQQKSLKFNPFLCVFLKQRICIFYPLFSYIIILISCYLLKLFAHLQNTEIPFFNASLMGDFEDVSMLKSVSIFWFGAAITAAFRWFTLV